MLSGLRDTPAASKVHSSAAAGPAHQQQPRLKLRFVRASRGEDPDAARTRRGGTTIYYDAPNGQPWEHTSHQELLGFLAVQVSMDLSIHDVNVANLFVETGDDTTAPTYLLNRTVWGQVLKLWSTSNTTLATVFVEIPAVTNIAEIYNAYLVQLQKGWHARRAQPENSIAIQKICRTLEDEPDSTANGVCRSLLRLAELLRWRRFADDVNRIFGTPRCHPHPGIFYCWCGSLDPDTGYCRKKIKVRHLCDFTAFNRHLGRCTWAGAAAVRARLFEFEHFGGVIATELPENMPTIHVRSRLVLDFQPNILANGATFFSARV